MDVRKGVSALLFSLLLAAAVPVWAQEAALLAHLNSNSPITLGDAAALVGIAAGTLPAQSEPASAPERLRAIGFSLPTRATDSPVSAGEFAYLVVQLFDLPTGLLYSIFPGPRYAVRELESRQVLPVGTHPGSTLSGAEALRIVGMVLRAGGRR